MSLDAPSTPMQRNNQRQTNQRQTNQRPTLQRLSLGQRLRLRCWAQTGSLCQNSSPRKLHQSQMARGLLASLIQP